MAAQRKAKKKGLLTIPPELQEYISKKSRGIKQFAPEMEEWGQLSPEKTYEYWRQTEPEKLYMIQLKDLLWEMYQPYLTGKDVFGLNIAPLTDKSGNQFENDTEPDRYGRQRTAQEKAEARIAEIIDEAETKLASGFYPLETMPYYEESKAAISGRAFQSAYEDLLVDEMQKAQQLATTRRTMLANVGSEKGRQALQEYITYGEKQRLQEKLNKGEITQEDAETQIKELEKQAYGEGSAFEKWQHEQVGQPGAMGQRGVGQQQPGLLNMGIPMDEALRRYDLSGETSGYTQTQMSQERQKQITQSGIDQQQRLQAQANKGQLRAQLYPDWFQKFQSEFNAGYGQNVGLLSPIAAPASFVNWDTPEFRQYRQQQDIQYTQDYPNVYPIYQDLLSKNQVTQPFEQWYSDPAQALLKTQEDERRRRASAVAKGRLAPPTVNR